MRLAPTLLSAAVAIAAAANAALPRGWDNIGPVGGLFTALEADPTDAAHVAVLGEAIRETRDAGATWQQIELPCTPASQLKIQGDSIYVDCGFVIQHSRNRG